MKKIIVASLVACVTVIGSATELWWLVADDAALTEADGTTTSPLGQWNTAKIFASADGSNFVGTQIGSDWTAADIADIEFAYSDITGTSAGSFYVELWLNETFVGRSYVNFRSDTEMAQGATTAAALKNAGAIYNGGMSMATPYAFSQFTTSQVVPEPTSGLLMLIGLAGLALKRKRA